MIVRTRPRTRGPRLALAAALATLVAPTLAPRLEAQNAAFVHVVTAANQVAPAQTAIDHPLLNGRPSAVFFVGHLRNPPGQASLVSPHPHDVWFNGARWVIENADAGAHALGTSFAVWVPEVTTANPSYYAHQTASGNVVANLTVLDHPALNDNPDAFLTVTLHAQAGAHNHYFGIWYDTDSGRWTIFNEDQAAMPTGLRFMVGIGFSSMFVGQTYLATFHSVESNTEGESLFVGSLPDLWNLLVIHEYTGAFLNLPIGTQWVAAEGEHAIFVETLADMPLLKLFHRLGTRGIFSSRFESGTFLGWTVAP
jgi:hypothetical protein